MSTPPTFLSFNADELDFSKPESREAFATRMNMFIQEVIQLFTGNLTFGDNLFGQIYSVSFTTQPTYVSNDDFTTINLPWGKPISHRGAVLLSLKKADALTDVIKAPLMVYTTQTSAQSVRVDFITGLEDSTRYNATILVV